MASSTPLAPIGGPVSATPETRRVVSVDALRGFDMFWIIGGDSLAQALKRMSADGDSVFHSIGALFGD